MSHLSRRSHDRRPEQGAVTAETAMMLPLLAVFTVAMVWMVALGVVHVRAVDAARETARVLARGDDRGQAVALGRRVAPRGADIGVRDGDVITVTVSAPVSGPGALLSFLPSFTVRAQAVAAREGTP